MKKHALTTLAAMIALTFCAYAEGFPQGQFYMTTKSAEGQDLVLESAPLTLRKKGNYTGMFWTAQPVDNRAGYFYLTSQFIAEKNQVLEGADTNGQSAVVTNKAAGTMWKAVPADGGYYHLTTLFMEQPGNVLNGNVGEAAGANAPWKGAPHMVAKKSAGPEALWKFLPLASETNSEATGGGDVRTDPANDGKNAKFVKDGAMVEIYNKDEEVQKDGGPWILIKTADYEQGGVYRIKKADADVYLSLDNGKLTMAGPTVSVAPGGKKTKDHSKIATWVLHLNSGGWSIMSNANRANAISRTKEPKTKPLIAKTNLQRNQGYPSQIWMIKQIGFALNPEL